MGQNRCNSEGTVQKVLFDRDPVLVSNDRIVMNDRRSLALAWSGKGSRLAEEDFGTGLPQVLHKCVENARPSLLIEEVRDGTGLNRIDGKG